MERLVMVGPNLVVEAGDGGCACVAIGTSVLASALGNHETCEPLSIVTALRTVLVRGCR